MSPMTVRWKPLLVLSGLFVVIALVGFIAIAATLIPRRSNDILPAARAERKAGQFDKALIRYKQALQVDGRNAAIHEEMAAMFAEWAAKAPAERRPEILRDRLASLAEAAKYGKTLREPRRLLLAEALRRDDATESLHWAREVLALEPANTDAHFVAASDLLMRQTASVAEVRKSPVIPEFKRHLAALETGKAPEVRIAWLKALFSQLTGDTDGRDAALNTSRVLKPPADADQVDRTALLRLRALDAESTTDPAALAERVGAFQAGVRELAADSTVVPVRILRMTVKLEQLQKQLVQTASRSDEATRASLTALADAIEADVEANFRKSLETARQTDLGVYLTYADHLRYRGQRDRCFAIVEEGLKSPLAALPASAETVMSLHSVAVEAALTETKDPGRFEKAEPHIKALIGSSKPRFQGLGHLFQGAIDLERSGVVGTPTGAGPDGTKAASSASQPKLRTSALNHLKIAAEQLPDFVEAQARYGVALILAQEPNLGRQYLQNALRIGRTNAQYQPDPQYQIWAAWSVIQAGYPEEAEPIVKHLLAEVEAGRLSRDLVGTIHLLSGEIHQARRSPDDLNKALAEYNRSYAGQEPPPAVQIRMAQIDAQLNRPQEALKRIEGLRAQGQGGAYAEHLAVLTLLGMGKTDEAESTLAKARATYPGSEELVSLEVSLLLRNKKAREADGVLADFLAKNPDSMGVLLTRAQVLADQLGDVKEARKLVASAAERSDNSGPLVQLAQLDMKLKDYPAVDATIAKVRSRWKEAADADLLDAQLAIEQGQPARAVAFFDAALKKDPGNKMVQFWKAQLESRLGNAKGASQALETLAREGSSKELENGLSLTAAAQLALANLALQQGEFDAAIRRYETIRGAGGPTALARGDRWQLAAAYAAKGQWPAARREVASMVNDSKNPPSNDERVRAANFYRLNNEPQPAVAQLDYVLAQDPAHAQAVVTRAYMLADEKKPAEAAALIRKAIAAPQKEKPPAVFFLMLAALENILPPESGAGGRALAALDQGLDAHPKALVIVQAKYRLLLATKGPKEAVAFVESQAQGGEDDKLTRLLAEVYRDRNDYAGAERTLRGLVAKDPKDADSAAALVRVTAQQAEQAGDRGDRTAERALDEKLSAMIRDFKGKFPTSPVFLQEEFEQAFRRGDLARAEEVTKEVDRVAKNSPVGPLLRARLYEAQGHPRDVAAAYAEALERNPWQPEIRILLGQTSLKIGNLTEAVRQARLVQETEPDRADALLLEARALTEPFGTPDQTAARRAEALGRLNAAVKKQPRFAPGYHLIAEIQRLQGQPEAAVATLRRALEAVPDDAVGLAQLVDLLAQPAGPGAPAAPEKLVEARSLAGSVAGRDTRGNLTLALAVGFHKAGQVDDALAWAEKAAAKLDAPVVHLNFGDILLAKAEASRDADQAKALFRRAVDQYDLVLKTQANSVEAVNNKAWILHTYLNQSPQALEIATALLKRVDPSTLPGEFYDTLGAVQEALGQKREAEDSYNRGLRKAPEHPVLNYHMGKLIITDARRSGLARGYLEKAFARRDRLTPTMAAEVASLMAQFKAN
jgi:tetratricopeptide (TPR) repeat protein